MDVGMVKYRSHCSKRNVASLPQLMVGHWFLVLLGLLLFLKMEFAPRGFEPGFGFNLYFQKLLNEIN